MFIKKKNLMVMAVCTLMLAGASMLPGELSPISSAYAKGSGGGGGHGGGNGGGNGGGHSGGAGGAGHSDGAGGIGMGKGLSGDRAADRAEKAADRAEDRAGKVAGRAEDRAEKAADRAEDRAERAKKAGVAEKAVRDRGISGKHSGSLRNNNKGHGSVTSGVAHSKATRGVAKATSIAKTTPGEHNTKGLSNAATSTMKNDR